MDQHEFEAHLTKIMKRWTTNHKQQYKYNTKEIETKINQLRQDLHDLVEVLGCFADGYSVLKVEINEMKERIDQITQKIKILSETIGL